MQKKNKKTHIQTLNASEYNYLHSTPSCNDNHVNSISFLMQTSSLINENISQMWVKINHFHLNSSYITLFSSSTQLSYTVMMTKEE